MASNYNNDNFYTHTFTPREYQVELLERIKSENTIICSSTSATKAFVAVKLIQELAHKMRSENGYRAFYLINKQSANVLLKHIDLLTDLAVTVLNEPVNINQWSELKSKYIVFVMPAEICNTTLHKLGKDMSFLNLIIIDDCLYGDGQRIMKNIMDIYSSNTSSQKPRIVGFVSGLLSEDLVPGQLEAEIIRLEHLLNATVDTSSEITTLIRLSCKPRELILMCNNPIDTDLTDKIRNVVLRFKEFILEHRYDPSEIYSEDFLEEYRNIPDPKATPLKLIEQFLHILNEYGCWCADQAALHLLIIIEKLKIKIAYERHYLLLCALSTTLLSVRNICDSSMEGLDDKEKMYKFSTHKIHRLVEVLKELGPPESEKPAPIERISTPQPEIIKQSKKSYKGQRRPYQIRPQPDDSICALIFVDNALIAKVMHTLLSTLGQQEGSLWWMGVLYTAEKVADPITEPREAEIEHRRQEEVLKKFRAHDCNIMIATAVLEQGFDLPKCNLVIRLDVPKTFHSYIQTKARARTSTSYYISLLYVQHRDDLIKKYAQYIEVEQVLLKKCGNVEPNNMHVHYSDCFCEKFKPYITREKESVSLSTAVQLINRYCAKLPSDTFTKLVPNFQYIFQNNKVACTLRLPINSPVKYKIVTSYYDTEIIAKRIAAFQMCQLLHKSNELDDYLNPITKENFRAIEDDWNDFSLEDDDRNLSSENIEQRPGTTKRRQYYYKRIANALRNCLPQINTPTYFYKIHMTLTCPIPEEQNTRGRKIYPPEESKQGFGILTSKEIPQICPFPIFTRSGEVNVSLELCADNIFLNEDEIDKISEFLNYTFTSVLRLQKYQMLFNPSEAVNNYFIIPTLTEGDDTKIDWDFLNLIYENRDVLPETIADEERVDYVFDASHYNDAVVMPWYRNQDQPQYFYVAEICANLNPASEFPGSAYATFEEYYNRKYEIQIQNKDQHLLDVDHTSARLNFLTPRYVNRKGVALPTSSEETKRAKRENLEQKQILVPELCAIHPFPASLWRKAVCLPCILYRVNALLLADQIRRTVAAEINLGQVKLRRDFVWEPLNFGWSLSDVLKPKPKESDEANEIARQILDDIIESSVSAVDVIEMIDSNNFDTDSDVILDDDSTTNKDSNSSKEDKWLEIGTWSNDMAYEAISEPSVRYGSPTSWMHSTYGYNEYDDFSDTESYYSSDDGGSDSQCAGLTIEFKGDYTAEAFENQGVIDDNVQDLQLEGAWETEPQISTELEHKFKEACEEHIRKINSEIVIETDKVFKKNINSIKDECKKIECIFEESFDFVPENKRLAANVEKTVLENGFSFDCQPDLSEHPGPSPSVILQALTMSNANDGINLERLETIGDSFLKYAITDYLYSKYENTHEGKLSHLRSKQVSNLNLYRLGKRKQLGEMMIATKFDPHDNWLPPGYCVSKELEEALNKARIPGNYLTLADYVCTRNMSLEELCLKISEQSEFVDDVVGALIPYNLVTQHSIPDKSIADCVEALIGAYLIECGPRGALLFMAWLGIRVLPYNDDGSYGQLQIPDSPLLFNAPTPFERLDLLLDGYDKFEIILGYKFKDRSYLLQALTHASYSPNDVTDCYQRLEFLGDAVLDYLITRHLYEDKRMHSPGALTDLRSALVNNTIFASLAVKYNFHKYFRYLSPALHQVIEKFIRIQELAGHKVTEELFLLNVEDNEEVEDIEVPKVLGDVFESVAGAIFLDSGRSLDAVWKVYYEMMKNEIEQFSGKVPKSPIRELLELEPETAKFGPAEKLADGKKVRVSVEVFGKGVFKGIGRNYRIAKCTAAKCALKHLKKQAPRLF